MSELIEQMEAANAEFVARHGLEGCGEVSKYPSRQLAVLTCMDTRLLDFLEPAMGLRRGDAKIIKVAGNTVSESFDSVIGSLMVAVYELHVQHIIVMGHDDCGMLKTTADGLCRHMAAAGVDEKNITAILPKLRAWADSISDIDESVRRTVQSLRDNPFLPDSVTIYGMVIHPGDGAIRIVDDGV
ncbi:MAG: carbonic anhydrase [Megasphaera sp.]|jgi:carbonic anhydrase|nr:carbonic anhydrase [Megasphaera sp.]MCI1248801.1 carbonic anhydrase [Megasphaera sp.]